MNTAISIPAATLRQIATEEPRAPFEVRNTRTRVALTPPLPVIAAAPQGPGALAV